MRSGSKAAVAVGALSGGLLGYYLTRTQPWASLKKVAAVVALAFGGGAIGYGISKLPSGSRSLRAYR